MTVLVILAHPDENSFNHAIADVVLKTLEKNNHDVIFHDLYEERFNPFLEIKEIPKESKNIDKIVLNHCNDLTKADKIIIIHPNWWGQPPAVLKGWIDRVIRPGVAYEFVGDDKGEGIPAGLLNAETAIVFNTSNTNEKRENEVFGDPLERIWKDCIFDLCGIKIFYRRMFRVVVTSTEDERKKWLLEVKTIIEKYC